jgi:translin
MDEAYYVLVTFDYPDAVTNGLRRTTDMVRGVAERTRGDLTTTMREEELQKAIARAVEKLGG